MRYLDANIAAGVMDILLSIRPLHKVTANIPDVLPLIVGIGTLLMWGEYAYRLYKKKADKATNFLLLAGIVLPAAYIAKTFLKFIFGRTDPRSWLIWNKSLEFHWFSAAVESFPSGHMTVFAAFGTAILLYYPRYRVSVVSFLVLLGAALILTDYHFLSDVIAGAYLGTATAYTVNYFVNSQRNISK